MCEVPCIGFLERLVSGDTKNCVKMEVVMVAGSYLTGFGHHPITVYRAQTERSETRGEMTMTTSLHSPFLASRMKVTRATKNTMSSRDKLGPLQPPTLHRILGVLGELQMEVS
jgi:hypothetical protein